MLTEAVESIEAVPVTGGLSEAWHATLNPLVRTIQGRWQRDPFAFLFAGGSLLALAAIAIVVSVMKQASEEPPPLTAIDDRPLTDGVTPSRVDPPTVADPLITRPAPSCPDRMVPIPAGRFLMGSADGVGTPGEHPAHWVTLDAFCMDRTEVTVARYRECARAGNCVAAPTTPSTGADWSEVCNGDRIDRDTHPINCISWQAADAFCGWATGRLPTEAEWELAARGSMGRDFPWGATMPSESLLNACGPECAETMGGEASAFSAEDGWLGTAPVGTFPNGASMYGVLDMAGNVAEWTGTRYGRYGYEHTVNPEGPRTGATRVVRGGGWLDLQFDRFRAARRDAQAPGYRGRSVGFRCVRSLAPHPGT